MIIGTAGHVDHGKTSLVRALTGVDTDRLKEEKARGISIDLGFAYLPAPNGAVLGFVDVPGHERLIHNMLAGAGGIDYVLLVVAADDGVMPQTIEHLAIVDLLGIERGIVAITKPDLVPPERLNEVEQEISRVLSATCLRRAGSIRVSARTGEGIDELRARLSADAENFVRRSAGGRFRLAVDRSFSLPGIGTVVTGTVLSGAVSNGDQIVISPSGRQARVRAIHTQNRASEEGRAGDRCALNLAGDRVGRDSIARGDMVVDPSLHAPTDRIDVRLRVLASEQKAIVQWMPVRLHHAAAEVGARIVLLGDPIGPEQEGFAQLVLERPIAAAAGDRFIVRDTSARRTIGGGKFVDLRAPARRRRTPERIAQLEAAATGDAKQALEALVTRASGYVDLSAFVRDRALSAVEREDLAKSTGLTCLQTPTFEVGVSPATWLRLKDSVTAVLEGHHAENPGLAGMGPEKLRRALDPRLPAPVFEALVQGLARTSDVVLDGAWIRLPGHAVRLPPRDEALWEKARPLIGGSERFRPPRVRDVAGAVGAGEADVRRLFKVLSRMGRVDEVAQDHFFLREAVAEMAEISVRLAEADPGGQFSAAQLRDQLNNGRKVAIQILEFFDRHGLTIRRGDMRRVNRSRLSQFRGWASDSRGSIAAASEESGRAASPVGRPDFKSGRGRETVLGGFDSHSLPPDRRGAS